MASEVNDHEVLTLARQVRQSFEDHRRVIIRGGGSKSFLGHIEPDAEPLDVAPCRGIISYEPEELVIRVRCGTPLAEVQQVLAGEGQMLAFEPPGFGENATIGGTVSSGIAGPRRPWAGTVRDFVLGASLVTGDGRIVEFGGQVMKNVAGYDVSRLVIGAMGTLGIVTDVSMKVLPCPGTEVTLQQKRTVREALDFTVSLSASPMPVSATCFHDDCLSIRLSGSESSVRQAAKKIGGEETDNALWAQVANHEFEPLSKASEVWRVSVPPASPVLLDEASVIEWGGGQRWVVDPDFNPRDRLGQYDGHVTLFRRGKSGEPAFHPLTPGVLVIHRGLKSRFDPGGILNPGRLYEGL